jgi:hypothetical protein
MHLRVLALAIAFLSGSAAAIGQPLESSWSPTQTDFRGVRAKVGDHLYITDPDRRVEISGRVTTLSAGEITVDGQRFVPRPGLKIERAGDTIWDGGALGFVLGGLAGVTFGAEACLRQPLWHCFVASGIEMGALGAYIDWKHKGRTTVFLGAANAPRSAADAGERPLRTAVGPTAFDFTALRIKRGDRVAVTAPDGTQIDGVVTALTRNLFRVGVVDLSASSPVLVERIGDPIWDGVAYGVGIAAMATIATQTGLRAGAARALVYGSIGGLIDAAVHGRTAVYGGTDALGRSSSVRLVPEIGPHSKAAALVLRF